MAKTIVAFLVAVSVANAAPSSVAAGSARLGAFLARGQLTLEALKSAGLTDGRLLSRDHTASVYAGTADPVFQIVLWKEKRVLFELDPKKQSLPSLEAFNADWSALFPSAASKPGTLDTLMAGPREHLKEYCRKLPPGARCEVLVWTAIRGRAVRVDIHLKQGPPVPKAIEFSPVK